MTAKKKAVSTPAREAMRLQVAHEGFLRLVDRSAFNPSAYTEIRRAGVDDKHFAEFIAGMAVGFADAFMAQIEGSAASAARPWKKKGGENVR